MCDLYKIYSQVYNNLFKLLKNKYFVDVCKLNNKFIAKMIHNNYTIKEAHAICISVHLNLMMGCV